MPSQVYPGSIVAANYLKTQPSTKLGQRELAFVIITVSSSDLTTNEALPNSLFTLVVRAVQLNAEIYAIGTPSAGVVTVVIAKDTAADDIESRLGSNTIADSITEGLTDSGYTLSSLTINKLLGGGFTTDPIDSWNVS